MKAEDLIFEPTHEKCEGCHFINPSKGRLGYAKCRVYIKPCQWWRHGNCPLATHKLIFTQEAFEKLQRRVRVGQQKSKKWRVR